MEALPLGVPLLVEEPSNSLLMNERGRCRIAFAAVALFCGDPNKSLSIESVFVSLCGAVMVADVLVVDEAAAEISINGKPVDSAATLGLAISINGAPTEMSSGDGLLTAEMSAKGNFLMYNSHSSRDNCIFL